MSSNWSNKTYSLESIRSAANHYDELTIEGGKPFAMDFLYWSGIIPQNVDWKRRNAVPRTSLDPDAIPAGYLAEVAYEWDDDGSAPIHAFVNMLAFECLDTRQNSVVNETMTDLGRR